MYFLIPVVTKDDCLRLSNILITNGFAMYTMCDDLRKLGLSAADLYLSQDQGRQGAFDPAQIMDTSTSTAIGTEQGGDVNMDNAANLPFSYANSNRESAQNSSSVDNLPSVAPSNVSTDGDGDTASRAQAEPLVASTQMPVNKEKPLSFDRNVAAVPNDVGDADAIEVIEIDDEDVKFVPCHSVSASSRRRPKFATGGRFYDRTVKVDISEAETRAVTPAPAPRKPSRWKCKKCNYMARDLVSRNRHYTVHSGFHRFTCTDCSNKYKTHKKAMQHSQVHNKENTVIDALNDEVRHRILVETEAGFDPVYM